MTTLKRCLHRTAATGLAILFALPFGAPGTAFAQQAGSQPAGEVSSSAPQSPDANSSANTQPQAGGAQPADTNPLPETRTSTQEPQKEEPAAPVGTAVAPYEKGIGVAASRPAGAVIAPAKQKRTRSFLIKSALVLGAAVAVGSVVGLSSASPSRPAGAR